MPSETDRILGELVRGTERALISLSTNITANLQAETRVDIGWARANWIPSIGVPAQPITLADPSDPTSSDVSNAASRQASGTTELLRYSLSRGTIFIVNNAVYIGILEEMDMFVEDAIEDALSMLPNNIN